MKKDTTCVHCGCARREHHYGVDGRGSGFTFQSSNLFCPGNATIYMPHLEEGYCAFCERAKFANPHTGRCCQCGRILTKVWDGNFFNHRGMEVRTRTSWTVGKVVEVVGPNTVVVRFGNHRLAYPASELMPNSYAATSTTKGKTR